MLELLGYQVTKALDGPEALSVYQKDPMSFDLLMLDLNLPSMSGLTLLEEVRKVREDQKVVMCSGDVGFQQGEDAPPCLYKPYRVKELKSFLDTYLQG